MGTISIGVVPFLVITGILWYINFVCLDDVYYLWREEDMIIVDDYSNDMAEKKYYKFLEYIKHEYESGGKINIDEMTDSLVLEEFSDTRLNVISWMDFEKDTKVLYLNSGCGTFTSFFSDFAKQVDCVDNSKVKCEINHFRNQDLSNVNIYVGELNRFKNELSQNRYNYIFINEATCKSFEEMETLKSLLEKNGKIILSCVNKYGLKYWSGTKYSKANKTFDILYDYDCLCKKTIENYCKEYNMNNKIYYLYPDEKNTMMIYSDAILPKEGELVKNYYTDEERIILFDEIKAFNSIIHDGVFDMFANAYLVIIEGD